MTLTDANGCVSLDTVLITVTAIFTDGLVMPNAFTPNNDGINDIFRIVPGHEVDLISLQVFHRWGALLFQTTDANAGWDGTFKGDPQPVGNYVYIVRYRAGGEEKMVTGNVVLVR